MSQTLFAVFALALLSFLMLGTLGDRNDTQADRLETIVADHARAHASGVIDRAMRLPFDGNDGPRTLPGAFGIPAYLPIPAVLDSAWAHHVGDLDDLDRLSGRAVTLVGDPVSGADRPLVLDTQIAVHYVAPTAGGWAVTSDTTGQKRVVVRTSHADTGTEVELQRIVSDLRTR
ncbi:hypothetical protein [Rubrivirga sp. IMCC45206]|uniref:hypothetical protein n=1 Tax=Rubrivirga sp. IMCC45206 TaxID=3391614 RepID=UPI00399026C0